MWFPSRLRNRASSDVSRSRSPLRSARFRPRLESLEGRAVPSTLLVTNTLDDYTPGSLRGDINVAHSGDTIAFDPGLAGQQILLSGSELDVNTNLTIQGLPAGSVINGGGLSRVFAVHAGVSVTLTNLTITGGIDIAYSGAFDDTTLGEGAGIFNLGTLTVQNCMVTGNTGEFGGPRGGGGIFNGVGATLTVAGSTLSANSASNGGGIFNDGTLTVTGSTLSGNTAGDGGGIYNAGGSNKVSGTLSISNSTLSGNSAGSEGGGIDNYYGSQATVMNCTITGNTAGYEGGGIYNAGRLTVGGSAFSANTPDNVFGGYTNKKGNTFG